MGDINTFKLEIIFSNDTRRGDEQISKLESVEEKMYRIN